MTNVPARHATAEIDVRDHARKFPWAALQDLDRTIPIVRVRHLKAPVFKRALQQVSNKRLVFDQQHLGQGIRLRHMH